MTIRRVPHCTHWGAFSLLVENGDIVGVEPFPEDPSPSPIIRSVAEWADPALRVPQPMVREGWLRDRERSDGAGRGREAFVPVSWDEATALVAGEIDRVRHAFGNASIFAGSYGWTSAGRFHHAPTQVKRMLNLVGGYTGHVDTYSIAAGVVMLRWALGDESFANGRSNTLDTVAEHAEVLVVFGAMSPRTSQNESGGIARHTLEDDLRRMKARGVQVILVSPCRDDLPEWLEAEWWPVRPNTDTALMLGLAGEIVAAGRHDAGFLDRCCSGGDAFLAYLKGESDGVAKDAAWAARITDTDADRIRALAAALTAKRSMLSVSWSLQRADHGEQPFWAGVGLAAVIGQIGLPGGGVGFGYGSLGGVGAPFALSRSPAMSQGRKAISSFIPVARITDLLLDPGGPFTYDGKQHTYPDTRLVYWAGGNPFHHHQDINRLKRAWARPETIVVQEPFWTATARHADIVLPATTSIERNDLAGNKRCDFILAMKQAIDPVAQSRPDYDIVRGIAERLGVEAAFSEGLDEMQWVARLYEDARRDARQRHDFALPDFDTFWEQGYAKVPVKAQHTGLAEFRENPDAHRLGTETGRIVLYSERLAELAYADCPPHPAWLAPAEWLGDADATAKLPFHLISHQPSGKLHSQLDFAAVSLATKRDGREVARINPEDAARLGIGDGDTVRLWNGRGECLAVAGVTETVRPGVVVLPTGSWYQPADESERPLEIAGNPNVLTLDKGSSSLGQGCAAHTCLIAVERYQGNVPHRPVFAPPRLARAG